MPGTKHTTRPINVGNDSYYYFTFSNREIELTNLIVKKTVKNGTAAPGDAFRFQILDINHLSRDPVLPLTADQEEYMQEKFYVEIFDSNENKLDAAKRLSSEPGSNKLTIISLENGDEAKIYSLAVGMEFQVREYVESGDKYISTYNIPNSVVNKPMKIVNNTSGVPTYKDTDIITLSDGMEVEIVNTVPETPASPSPSPGTPSPTPSPGTPTPSPSPGTPSPSPGVPNRPNTPRPIEPIRPPSPSPSPTTTPPTSPSATPNKPGGGSRTPRVPSPTPYNPTGDFGDPKNPGDVPDVDKPDDEVEKTPVPSTEPVTTPAPETSTAPKTADGNNQAVNIALLFAGVSCVVGAVAYQFKKRKKQPDNGG